MKQGLLAIFLLSLPIYAASAEVPFVSLLLASPFEPSDTIEQRSPAEIARQWADWLAKLEEFPDLTVRLLEVAERHYPDVESTHRLSSALKALSTRKDLTLPQLDHFTARLNMLGIEQGKREWKPNEKCYLFGALNVIRNYPSPEHEAFARTFLTDESVSLAALRALSEMGSTESLAAARKLVQDRLDSARRGYDPMRYPMIAYLRRYEQRLAETPTAEPLETLMPGLTLSDADPLLNVVFAAPDFTDTPDERPPTVTARSESEWRAQLENFPYLNDSLVELVPYFYYEVGAPRRLSSLMHALATRKDLTPQQLDRFIVLLDVLAGRKRNPSKNEHTFIRGALIVIQSYPSAKHEALARKFLNEESSELVHRASEVLAEYGSQESLQAARDALHRRLVNIRNSNAQEKEWIESAMDHVERRLASASSAAAPVPSLSHPKSDPIVFGKLANTLFDSSAVIPGLLGLLGLLMIALLLGGSLFWFVFKRKN